MCVSAFLLQPHLKNDAKKRQRDKVDAFTDVVSSTWHLFTLFFVCFEIAIHAVVDAVVVVVVVVPSPYYKKGKQTMLIMTITARS